MSKITVKTKKVRSITETFKLVVNGQRIIRTETRDLSGDLLETNMRYPNGRPMNNRLIEEHIIDFLNARDKKLNIIRGQR